MQHCQAWRCDTDNSTLQATDLARVMGISVLPSVHWASLRRSMPTPSGHQPQFFLGSLDVAIPDTVLAHQHTSSPRSHDHDHARSHLCPSVPASRLWPVFSTIRTVRVPRRSAVTSAPAGPRPAFFRQIRLPHWSAASRELARTPSSDSEVCIQHMRILHSVCCTSSQSPC